MLKAANKIKKLLKFLIRILTKAVTTGIKTIEAVKQANEKVQKLTPLLLKITDILEKLKEYEAEINNIAEEGSNDTAGA